jgi:hypothetical protein
MAVESIGQMTQAEFRDMLETVVEASVARSLLEILGDPDKGLEIRAEVRDRLLRQTREVAAGQHGQRLEDVVRGLERR